MTTLTSSVEGEPNFNNKRGDNGLVFGNDLPQGKFLDLKNVLQVLCCDNVVSDIPCGIKNDVYFVCDSSKLDINFTDDCPWSSGSPIHRCMYVCLENNALKKVSFKEDLYVYPYNANGEKIYILLDPQPSHEDILEVHTRNFSLSYYTTYKKRVSWLIRLPARIWPTLPMTACVEYMGTSPEPDVNDFYPTLSSTVMESNLSASMESNLPVSMESNLPVSMESNLPVSMESNLPVSMESNLPVSMESNLPVSMESNPPVSMESNLPVSMESNLPVSMESNLPVSMESILPVRMESILPVRMESNLPVRMESNLPVSMESNLPVTMESNLPVSTCSNTRSLEVQSSILSSNSCADVLSPEIIQKRSPLVEFDSNVSSSEIQNCPRSKAVTSIVKIFKSIGDTQCDYNQNNAFIPIIKVNEKKNCAPQELSCEPGFKSIDGDVTEDDAFDPPKDLHVYNSYSSTKIAHGVPARRIDKKVLDYIKKARKEINLDLCYADIALKHSSDSLLGTSSKRKRLNKEDSTFQKESSLQVMLAPLKVSRTQREKGTPIPNGKFMKVSEILAVAACAEPLDEIPKGKKSNVYFVIKKKSFETQCSYLSQICNDEFTSWELCHQGKASHYYHESGAIENIFKKNKRYYDQNGVHIKPQPNPNKIVEIEKCIEFMCSPYAVQRCITSINSVPVHLNIDIPLVFFVEYIDYNDPKTKVRDTFGVGEAGKKHPHETIEHEMTTALSSTDIKMDIDLKNEIMVSRMMRRLIGTPLPEGTFLDMESLLKVLMDDSAVNFIPQGIKHDVYFVCNYSSGIYCKNRKIVKDKADDLGPWVKSDTTRMHFLLKNETCERCYFKSGIFYQQKREECGFVLVPYEPQPSLSNILVIQRNHSTNSSKELPVTVWRRITWVEMVPSFIDMPLPSKVCVEYISSGIEGLISIPVEQNERKFEEAVDNPLVSFLKSISCDKGISIPGDSFMDIKTLINVLCFVKPVESIPEELKENVYFVIRRCKYKTLCSDKNWRSGKLIHEYYVCLPNSESFVKVSKVRGSYLNQGKALFPQPFPDSILEISQILTMGKTSEAYKRRISFAAMVPSHIAPMIPQTVCVEFMGGSSLSSLNIDVVNNHTHAGNLTGSRNSTDNSQEGNLLGLPVDSENIKQEERTLKSDVSVEDGSAQVGCSLNSNIDAECGPSQFRGSLESDSEKGSDIALGKISLMTNVDTVSGSSVNPVCGNTSTLNGDAADSNSGVVNGNTQAQRRLLDLDVNKEKENAQSEDVFDSNSDVRNSNTQTGRLLDSDVTDKEKDSALGESSSTVDVNAASGSSYDLQNVDAGDSNGAESERQLDLDVSSEETDNVLGESSLIMDVNTASGSLSNPIVESTNTQNRDAENLNFVNSVMANGNKQSKRLLISTGNSGSNSKENQPKVVKGAGNGKRDLPKTISKKLEFLSPRKLKHPLVKPKKNSKKLEHLSPQKLKHPLVQPKKNSKKLEHLSPQKLKHPFVQCVNVAQASVSSLILYTEEQLLDIWRFCCLSSNFPSVLGVKKVLKLHGVVVTVLTYSNRAIVDSSTSTHPLLIGPIILHEKEDFQTYKLCFAQLQKKFKNFSRALSSAPLVIGSDHVHSKQRAIAKIFKTSVNLTCIEDLKEHMQKVMKQKTWEECREGVESVMDKLFGIDGIANRLNQIHYGDWIEDIGSDEILPEVKLYFEGFIAPVLRENLVAFKKHPWIAPDWNNSCKHVEQDILNAVNHLTQREVVDEKFIADLADALYTTVQKQMDTLQEALIIDSNTLVLCENFKHFSVSRETWSEMNAEQRQETFLRFLEAYEPLQVEGLLTLPWSAVAARKKKNNSKKSPKKKGRVRYKRTIKKWRTTKGRVSKLKPSDDDDDKDLLSNVETSICEQQQPVDHVKQETHSLKRGYVKLTRLPDTVLKKYFEKQRLNVVENG